MPSGPVEVSATSPLPAADTQPSGRGSTITGATGSGTEALAVVALAPGGGKHATALGGMWSGTVTSTPGTGSAGSDSRGGLAPMAVPAVVFSQPTATPVARQSRPTASLVARKRKRQFAFHVLVRPAREVDGDLGDGASGERERRLVAARHTRTAVAPDGEPGPRQPERPGMGRHVRQGADHLAVDEQRQVTERGVAVLDRSRPRVANPQQVPAQRHRAGG